MASLLVVLTPPLLLGAVCIVLLGISRSGKQRPSLQHYEHTHAFAHDCSRQTKPAETSGTLGSSMATTRRTRPATSTETILQFVLDALHHLTGLPLLMVNQPEHNLPCLNRTSVIETQMRADQKNAELLDSPTSRKERTASSTWSDFEAPEEEMSDLSSDEDEVVKAAGITP
ncbi:RxLR effector protein, partial [Phytophthora megakarya]